LKLFHVINPSTTQQPQHGTCFSLVQLWAKNGNKGEFNASPWAMKRPSINPARGSVSSPSGPSCKHIVMHFNSKSAPAGDVFCYFKSMLHGSGWWGGVIRPPLDDPPWLWACISVCPTHAHWKSLSWAHLDILYSTKQNMKILI